VLIADWCHVFRRPVNRAPRRPAEPGLAWRLLRCRSVTRRSSSATTFDGWHAAGDANDFSPIVGGPLYRLYRRLHLLVPPVEKVSQRIAAILIVTWLPLSLIALFGPHQAGGGGTSFWHDVSTQVRLLIVMPLLLAAEVTAHRNLAHTVGQFVDRQLVRPGDEPRFAAAVASAQRWRDSAAVEVVLFIASVTLGHWIWLGGIAERSPSWMAWESGGVHHLTPAGYWLAFVSLPLFRFMILRWCYRLLVWHRLLWQLSRMRLNLSALHPDRAAGLGFLRYGVLAFTLVLVAVGASFAGLVGHGLLNEGTSLGDYKMQLVAVIAIALPCVLVSQAFFIPLLFAAKRAGHFRYGSRVSSYVRAFEHKWLTRNARPDAAILGSSDIQSLSDLGQSYSVVQETKLVPIGKVDVIVLAIALLIPVVPVVLATIPLRAIVTGVFHVLV